MMIEELDERWKNVEIWNLKRWMLSAEFWILTLNGTSMIPKMYTVTTLPRPDILLMEKAVEIRHLVDYIWIQEKSKFSDKCQMVSSILESSHVVLYHSLPSRCCPLCCRRTTLATVTFRPNFLSRPSPPPVVSFHSRFPALFYIGSALFPGEAWLKSV